MIDFQGLPRIFLDKRKSSPLKSQVKEKLVDRGNNGSSCGDIIT